MPVFDYKCDKCGTRYDVYHKVKEVAEDVVCPACGSKSHKKLMSVPAAPASAHDGEYSDTSCESGTCGCSGGACNMN
ncbi:MAG TPA: zinc ribbon domain-containing protein [Bacteroidota bacterium]|nr:zinc ribbon domain-containing protein [Bacteroidota bacterium]